MLIRWIYLYCREQNSTLLSRFWNWNSGFCTSSRRSHWTTSFPEPLQMTVSVLPFMRNRHGPKLGKKKGTSMSTQHLAHHREWGMVHLSHRNLHFENHNKKEALRNSTNDIHYKYLTGTTTWEQSKSLPSKKRSRWLKSLNKSKCLDC